MTPAELLQLSGSYWATCALHAGVKLDVFTQVAEGGRTAAELALRCGADQRAMGMLLDALTAMKLLHKTGNRYTATSSTTYLSRTSEHYLGHIIMHHHHLVQAWEQLSEAVISGAPVHQNSSRSSDAVLESFLRGMHNLASLNAPKIVSAIDLTGRRRLLDLAGGPGTYAVHFCLHNPDLRAVIFDLPTTRPIAEQTVAQFGLEQRIAFTAGDVTSDAIGAGYDVIWISHLLHSEGPTEAQTIIDKARQALDPGGILLIQEFILDESRAAPLFPALFSLNMLLGTPSGQAYTEGELVAMMTCAGFSSIRRLPIESPNGAGIIIGIQ